MDKIIKDRIDAIRQGLSADEYTKTEIGVLPSDWGIARLSDIAEKATKAAGTDSYETVSISAGIGFVNQAKKFGKELSGKQYEKYTVLHKGDFSYNKGNSNKYPQGCIYRLKDRETAAVPNVFESFRIQNECAEFYDHLFVSGFLNQQLSKKINHGVRDDGLLNLTEKDFYSCLLPVPSFAEQKKISKILDHYDKLINLCEEKVNEYKSLKKTCLRKMFPQNGSNVPEIRFPGFTDAWEQCKFDDILQTLPFKAYLKSPEQNGKHEIIQQGNDPIIGYANGEPCKDYENTVIFGDHTLSLYKPKKPFFVATDGVRIVKGVDNMDGNYLLPLLERNKPQSEGYKRYYSILANIDVFFTGNHREQSKIGKYFLELDNLITLHQREVEEYAKLKKAMTQLLLMGIVRLK